MINWTPPINKKQTYVEPALFPDVKNPEYYFYFAMLTEDYYGWGYFGKSYPSMFFLHEEGDPLRWPAKIPYATIIYDTAVNINTLQNEIKYQTADTQKESYCLAINNQQLLDVVPFYAQDTMTYNGVFTRHLMGSFLDAHIGQFYIVDKSAFIRREWDAPVIAPPPP